MSDISPSAIKTDAALEESLKNASTPDEMKAILAEAAVRQGLVTRDYYDPSVLIPADRTAASTKFTKSITGEVADVVAIKTKNEGAQQFIDIDLYHCKFAIGGKPRAQVKDLYEVCGQAQKSVSWCSQDKLVDLFSHLLRREPKRFKDQEATRFQKGTKEQLYRIKESSRSAVVRARIFIVQPALSQEGATTPQLALLAATENYLAETYQLKFGVIGSP